MNRSGLLAGVVTLALTTQLSAEAVLMSLVIRGDQCEWGSPTPAKVMAQSAQRPCAIQQEPIAGLADFAVIFIVQRSDFVVYHRPDLREQRLDLIRHSQVHALILR